MNVSSPPPFYGSTKEKNKEEKIGGRTIIDIHSCLDLCFVSLWLFSICARPTIVSTIHLLLFGVYVIIGGIILYETRSQQSISCSPLSKRKHRATLSAKKKKKRYKVELADLSEWLVSSASASHSPMLASSQSTYHPSVRYGVNTSVMLTIATFCCLVAAIQVIMQVLIAAMDGIDGKNSILIMFGFGEPQKYYEWILYLTLDLLLCILSVIMAYLHKNRNAKHRCSALNIINVEKVLLLTSKSLLPLYESEHSPLSIISSDEDEEESESVNSISTQKTMLISGAKKPRLPFFYLMVISCLLLIIAIAAPSILHIPYFLVVLLICLSPITDLWSRTKPMFNLIGPIYLVLHLMLISLYQVEAIRNGFSDTTAGILGLKNLHRRYWAYADTIKDQHIVPLLVATIFSIILLYGSGLRPILLHSSIYRAAHRRWTLSQQQPGPKGSIGYLSLQSTRHKAHSTSSLMHHAKSYAKKHQTYQTLPSEVEVEILDDKKEDKAPQIINESATSMISDRKTSIMNSMFSMSQTQEMKEEKKVRKSLHKKHKRRAKTVATMHGIVDDSSTDSDDDSDGIMARVQRQESLKQLRAEHTRKKTMSMGSINSIQTSVIFNSESVLSRKAREYLAAFARYIEAIGEWVKWRFFLWGPLICQLVCLWSCFPHHDAFFIVVMMWSYLSLFLLSDVFEQRDVFKYGAVFILVYSICAAFVKYISYIECLYDSSGTVFDYFGMKDYGDMDGSYMFVACVPFIVTSCYLDIQKLYRLISCEKIVTYLSSEDKTSKDRRKDVREMRKIAALYPQNFEAIMSKRGGSILHCCVDFRNADMIPIVAPFININGRDMYGRTALSQARKIHKYSSSLSEKKEMESIITGLWRQGCLRNKQMKWYSQLFQYIGMTSNYVSAAFYVMIEKLILFFVYVISTERADILHLIFLLYFLVFVGMGPLANKYWWTLVLYNGAAVTCRYIFVVFDIHPTDVLADEVGLRPPNDRSGLLFPVILLSFVILNYHLTRKRRERHTLLEFKFEQLILRNASRRSNSLVFAILYYLFYLIQDWCLLFVYIALMSIGLVQIHSIHLGYCICVFFCFFFHCCFKDPWKKIRAYWILIVTYCAVCFFGLYASQYSFIHRWLEDDIYPQTFSHKFFSLEDIGLTNDDTDNEKPFAMFMMLLGPVIAMILTVIQFGYFVTNKPHQEVKNNYYIGKISRLFCQLLYLGSIHGEKLTLLAAFIWCMYRVNLISMAYVTIICIALINRITLKSAWFPFQMIAIIVFILKYSYQYHYFEDHANNVNAKVVGFERFGISIGEKPADASTAKIWNGLGQEVTIILLSTLQCVLQWWIRLAPKHVPIEQQKPVVFWKQHRIYYEEFIMVNPPEKSYTFIRDDSINVQNKDKDKYDPLLGVMELRIDDELSLGELMDVDEFERDETPSSKTGRSMSHAALSSALRYTHITWTVIGRCLWRTLRRCYHVLTNMFYFYGVEISVIMMVFACFYRSYSFSWIYIVVAACYIYDSRKNTIKEWNTIRKIWFILWILMTLWLLVQYWIVIPYSIQDIIGECCGSKWWKLFHFNYDFAGSQYRMWWSWIAFIDYESTDLIFDFFVLLFVSLQRSNFIQHDVDNRSINGEQPLSQQLTLTKRMKRKSDADDNADVLWQSIKLQCLIYSDKILLLLMFIFGIMNVDLLSIVFLLFPFFELFFSNSTDKEQLLYWWHYVQIYNMSVITLFTVYQLPAIPAENVEPPFIAWQDILGVYKIYSNGNGYCYDAPCVNIFDNSSIIHNIILLIIIDLQIKILTSKSYENSVIATYREWILFSKYRCFHSALMMKFERLSQIDFYQNEKKIVQIQLEELFNDEQLHESLAFCDEELTYYPRLEGESADKAQKEEELYKRHIKGQFSRRDPNLKAVNQYNKDDIDVADSTDDDDDDDKEEKEGAEEKKEKEENEKDEDEKLFVPYEQGLFVLIDKDLYVINVMAPKERYCKISQFFDGGDEIPWNRYLRHLKKNQSDEPVMALFIVRREEVIEPDIDDNGNEIQKKCIKQYTENVAIMFREPMAARDFDTKAHIPTDAVACVILLPECSKLEKMKFTIGVKLSDLWIWFRMFMITFVDTSMHCNAMDLMKEITKIRRQLNEIDESQAIGRNGDLKAYYESQHQLLQNVPKPNQEQLDFYATLQFFYKDKQDRKERKMDKKHKEKLDRKQKQRVKQKVTFKKVSVSSLSTSSSQSPLPEQHYRTRTPSQETYFDRRRFSELIQAKDSLKQRLSHLKQRTFDGTDLEDVLFQDIGEEKKCDNLLEMAVEIQSKTLDYLNTLNFLSLFGCAILSHTQELAVLCFFITLFAHATILYSIVPISFLIFGLLQKPRADQQFWLWIAAYTQIIMVLKFLYQLDTFCMAQYQDPESQLPWYYYNIQSSYYCKNLNQGTVRWDQILGITKSEHSSSALSVLFADIVCLIFVAVHIMMLKKKGVWYQTEDDYDNYIELWFKEYETRQMMYNELEKNVARNQKMDYGGYQDDVIMKIKRIGEPERVYDETKDEFVENKVDYQSFAISECRSEHITIATWDLLMYKFHALMKKILPFEVRKYFFELIPPSFRLLNSSESICDEVKPGIDLYFWIFIVDLILLFWVLFFYQSMAETKAAGSESGGFTTSRFSGDMVFLLFIQIIFMIIDRIVYLTNTLILKLICQFISVIVFHWLIFVVWPLSTSTPFGENGLLIAYYLLRVIYWLLSCYQIAYGYPTFTRSHSRMSGDFTFFYWCFFIAYMAIPFIYEMRTLLEWVCIPTTLQLIELMKLEDIYGQLFKIKCINIMYMEQRNRGEPILMFRKFFAGGCVFIAIIGFLIVPLLLFSTASPATTTNPVTSSTLSFSIINIQGFGNLDLFSLSNYKITTIQPPNNLRPYFDAASQISQSIQFESDADSIFTVPTVLRERVSEILGCRNATHSLTPGKCQEQLHGTQIEMKYAFTRNGPDTNNPIEGLTFLNTFDLTIDEGLQLSQVLNSSNVNTTSFFCPTPYRQWLRLPASFDISIYNLDDNPQQNATLTLNVQQYESYWNIAPAVSFVLVSDNFVSSSLLTLTGVSSYSVIGFYAIVVYSFAQLLRLLYGDQVKEIIFQDLQNVDYIMRIVTAVKLARTQRNYHLEELLYRKLIRIYRDPALIVTLTKRLNEDQSNQLAFDGIRDTNYNNPQSFGWGIRNRKDNIMRRKTNEDDDDDDDSYKPPIVSSIK